MELKKSTRMKVCLRHQFLQGSWNFERMQNGGWCYSMLPALKELYPDQKAYHAALERHLEFYNTHPYVSAPILGIVLALEEKRANGENITDQQIHDTKVGLMGPLAGVGDPVFWFTLRPILAAIGIALALTQNIYGPLLFFLFWNVIRFAFLWKTQEMGYEQGYDLMNQLSDGFLKKVSQAACMMGMFVIGILVARYVNVYIPRIQEDLDAIFPGLAGLILFFVVTKLLKRSVSPVLLIVLIFVASILFAIFMFGI